MGCSAAKNIPLETIHNGGAVEGGVSESRKASIAKTVSDNPALESEEPETESLEAGTMNNVQKTQNGLSFDIAFEEGGGDEGGGGGESIIRKHPPKRFQRLEEQQTSPNLSLARLQEKLNEAEIRRQQILQQRVASAKVRNELKRQKKVRSEDGGVEDGDGNDEVEGDEEIEDDPNHLKVPPDAS